MHGSHRLFIGVSLPLWLWTAALFTLNSLPGSTLPDLPFPHADKLVHMLEFAVLCVLIMRYLLLVRRWEWKQVAWTAPVLAAGYAMFDELHQHFIPGRSCTWDDLFTDLAGIATGWICLALWCRFRGVRPW